MKLRKSKKGFTIVELVIVIAVIAVLTAILVPTFINLNAKAKKASDQSLVSNLNTALRMQEAEDGEKNATMYDAVMDLDNQGFKLPQLVAKSGEDLVYSLEDNQFYLSKDKKVQDAANKHDFWKIYVKMPSEQTYSIYAGLNWEDANVTGLKVGFDAGTNSVASIKYDATDNKTSIIRTNGGNLTVNAPNGTVKHYGNVDNVVIEKIATASYHEFGKVTVSLELQSGHAVVEPNGEVNELVIPEDASSASVNVESNGTVTTAVIDSDSAAVEIGQGAQVEQIVGDSSNVSGAGATNVPVEAKTLVYNEAGENKLLLKQALVAGAKYIVLAEDITVDGFSTADYNAGATITYDVTIDGNGHTMTGNSSITRGIWVDESNVVLTVKNLTIAGTKLERAIQINSGMRNVTVLLDNVKASVIYYAINICSDAHGSYVKVTNSEFRGWASINLWSSIKVDVSNSKLIGSSISKGEGFANICFEADTTGETNLHVSDAKVTVRNSIIRTEFNYTDGDGYQAAIGYNYFQKPNGADHNEFEAIDCTFEWEGGDDNLLLVYDYTAISTESTNVTIINGRKVESNTWYCEKSFLK